MTYINIEKPLKTIHIFTTKICVYHKNLKQSIYSILKPKLTGSLDLRYK